MLRALGARTRQVRVPADLRGLDGLVVPGGESTTMTLGIEREGLAGPLRELVEGGVPVLGSCAGLIMLDREHLGLMDIRRAAQRLRPAGAQLRGRRRAARRRRRPDARDLHPRAVDRRARRRGGDPRPRWTATPSRRARARMLAVSFHAELGDDERLHRLFLEMVAARAPRRASGRVAQRRQGRARDARGIQIASTAMGDANMKMTGHCLCGAVSYSAEAEPVVQAVCHCADCQRQSGSPYTVIVGVPRAALGGRRGHARVVQHRRRRPRQGDRAELLLGLRRAAVQHLRGAPRDRLHQGRQPRRRILGAAGRRGLDQLRPALGAPARARIELRARPGLAVRAATRRPRARDTGADAGIARRR